jgi:hypothetical protein
MGTTKGQTLGDDPGRTIDDDHCRDFRPNRQTGSGGRVNPQVGLEIRFSQSPDESQVVSSSNGSSLTPVLPVVDYVRCLSMLFLPCHLPGLESDRWIGRLVWGTLGPV